MEIRSNKATTENRIMELADNMAAAASMFNAHGYDTFIAAREELKNALHRVMTESVDPAIKK